MRSDLPRVARPAAATVAFGVTCLLASDQRYVRGEAGLTEAINDWPGAVGEPLELTMPLGTLGAGLLLTALVAVVTLRARATFAVLLASFVAWRLDNAAKELIERPRPPAVLGRDVVLRDSSATGWGFPSGHTTAAFALAAVLHPLLPGRWRWGAWLLAAAVGVARIYVGAHFPLDVVGGAALGAVIGGGAGLLVADGYRRRAR